MEPKAKARRPSLSGPVGKPPRPPKVNSSAHIIDLRKNGKAAPESAVAAPVKPKPVAKAPKPTHQVAAVDAEIIEAELEASAAPAKPRRLPEPRLLDDLAAPQRRFWPAFWRFMVLLIVLGAIVSGALYIYMTYFRA